MTVEMNAESGMVADRQGQRDIRNGRICIPHRISQVVVLGGKGERTVSSCTNGSKASERFERIATW